MTSRGNEREMYRAAMHRAASALRLAMAEFEIASRYCPPASVAFDQAAFYFSRIRPHAISCAKPLADHCFTEEARAPDSWPEALPPSPTGGDEQSR